MTQPSDLLALNTVQDDRPANIKWQIADAQSAARHRKVEAGGNKDQMLHERTIKPCLSLKDLGIPSVFTRASCQGLEGLPQCHQQG